MTMKVYVELRLTNENETVQFRGYKTKPEIEVDFDFWNFATNLNWPLILTLGPLQRNAD